jgi:hypothetical protein
MAEVEEIQLAAVLERPVKVPKLAVNRGNDRSFEQRFGNGACYGRRRGLPCIAALHFAVGERDRDLLSGFH